MKSRDFVYWFQGFFEIGEIKETALSKEQVVIIRNHINLVFAYEKKPTMPFVVWLQGFFQITNQDNVSIEQVEVIRTQLNNVFIHDIDPGMGNPTVQEQLNIIHTNGINVDSTQELMRC